MLLSACEGTDTPLAEEATATKEVEEVEETEEVEEIEEEPVILRVGWLTPIDCWSPWVCESIWTYGDLWGDTYFGKGPNCEPVPTRILDSWELSEDGKTWTLNVAEGVTFSNGEICDAQAAAGQLEWQASNPALADWYSVTAQLASIEILDEFTAKLNTNSPTTLFANVEGNFITLLPPSVYQNMSEEETFTFDWYPPIGTGPYIVTDWEQGSYIILEARPDYHRGKPPIDRIVVQIYSNTDAMVSAFLGGEIDMTGFLPPESLDTITSMPNVKIYEHVGSVKYEIEFNVSTDGNKHIAIDDPSVREAIDFAIDRQQLIDVALLGQGTLCPTNWACPPTMMDQINPDLSVTPYDPEHAKQILSDAGYLDLDEDGILETADGLPLKFRLFYEVDDAPSLTIADMISGWLGNIGIAVEINAVDYGMVSDLRNTRDFDMLIYNMYTDVNGPFQMDWTLSCWAVAAGAGGLNYSGFCNEEFDTLVETAYYTTDQEEFLELQFEAQAIVNSVRPFIVLAGVNEVQAVRDDRFEFPSEICHVSSGGWLSYEPIMNVIVK